MCGSLIKSFLHSLLPSYCAPVYQLDYHLQPIAAQPVSPIPSVTHHKRRSILLLFHHCDATHKWRCSCGQGHKTGQGKNQMNVDECSPPTPTPTSAQEEEKRTMCTQSSLSMTQVNNFFINQRKRHWSKVRLLSDRCQRLLPPSFATDTNLVVLGKLNWKWHQVSFSCIETFPLVQLG